MQSSPFNPRYLDQTQDMECVVLFIVRFMCFLILKLTNPKKMRSISHIDLFEHGYVLRVQMIY